MSPDEIRRRITAVPFKPFVLHIADGRSIPVHSRDFILVSPLGLSVDVYQPDETHDILDTTLITGITLAPPTSTTTTQPTTP
jgi:hypothetical protein